MFNIKKYREIQEILKKNTELCKIIAISKNHPKESVMEAIKLGVNIFGENRVMEAKKKFENIRSKYPKIELHLTGPLQSNKVKEAAAIFDVIHTLDREKIALEFSKYKDKIINKFFFVQINTGEEETKSGVYKKHLNDFINFCRKDIGLNIVGLMCIPPIDQDPRVHFEELKFLSKKYNCPQLSIGMSNDYEKAIEFDPTYIRLGTILFGNRN